MKEETRDGPQLISDVLLLLLPLFILGRSLSARLRGSCGGWFVGERERGGHGQGESIPIFHVFRYIYNSK
jgi:hypothetical protein